MLRRANSSAKRIPLQPHCAAAKKTLKEAAGKGAPQAVVIELDQTSEFDMQETQDYLRDLTGARSVPRIFMCVASLLAESPQGRSFLAPSR